MSHKTSDDAKANLRKNVIASIREAVALGVAPSDALAHVAETLGQMAMANLGEGSIQLLNDAVNRGQWSTPPDESIQ